MQDPQLSNGAHEPGHLLEEGFLEADTYSVSDSEDDLFVYTLSLSFSYLMIWSQCEWNDFQTVNARLSSYQISLRTQE